MVVLNIYGKIKPICISKKLGLYISNLPKEEHNNWNEMLYEEMILAQKGVNQNSRRYKLKPAFKVEKFYSDICSPVQTENMSKCKMMHEIVDNMICLYLDYNYNDMPLGGWNTNCFDGRLCEDDYAEKIINFINSIDETGNVPHCIYSSNDDYHNPYRFLSHRANADKHINSLKLWGKNFDDFLVNKNDYLQLDYLINSFLKIMIIMSIIF